MAAGRAVAAAAGGDSGGRRLARSQVVDRDPELRGEAVGDQRAVARLRVGLDAEERGCAGRRQLIDERVEVGAVEDLARVTAGVLGRELDA